MNPETTIPVRSDADVVAARQMGRQIAAELGFSSTDQTLIATAISEVARNIVTYAGAGEVRIERVTEFLKRGLTVTAVDEGPGIENPELALCDGYSTTKSLGLGLPGAKRLMDEFELKTVPGAGTTVVMRKWLK